MINSIIKCFLIVFFTFSLFNSVAQNILLDYDSIPISKPKLIKNTYHFDKPVPLEITIVTKKPKAASDINNKFWKNFSGGTLTMLTGISTESSEETLWVLEYELKASNNENSWKVNLFFSGEYSKSRERIRNDDGSVSVETEKVLYVDWSKGAYGVILEKNDTIGKLTLETNFQSDPNSLSWLSKIENESILPHSKTSKYFSDMLYSDFKITGTFYSNIFSIITSGNNFRSLIFIENDPLAVFQSEPNTQLLGKKNKITPYLLLDKTLSDNKIIEIFRLSLLNRLVSNTIRSDYFEM